MAVAPGGRRGRRLRERAPRMRGAPVGAVRAGRGDVVEGPRRPRQRAVTGGVGAERAQRATGGAARVLGDDAIVVGHASDEPGQRVGQRGLAGAGRERAVRCLVIELLAVVPLEPRLRARAVGGHAGVQGRARAVHVGVRGRGERRRHARHAERPVHRLRVQAAAGGATREAIARAALQAGEVEHDDVRAAQSMQHPLLGTHPLAARALERHTHDDPSGAAVHGEPQVHPGPRLGDAARVQREAPISRRRRRSGDGARCRRHREDGERHRERDEELPVSVHAASHAPEYCDEMFENHVESGSVRRKSAGTCPSLLAVSARYARRRR